MQFNFNKYSILVFLFFISFIVFLNIKSKIKKDKLIKKELAGIIASSGGIGKGIYRLEIKKHNEIETELIDISDFLFFKENNIIYGDSIYKSSNSKTIFFFKKNDNEYKLCCELIL